MKKAFIDYPTEHFERLIREGQLRQATKAVLSISVKTISPVDLSLHCSYLRRLGFSAKAILILRPIVYPKARSSSVATPIEVLEYAACLVRLQVLGEAEALLKTLDFNKNPTALLRLAFLHIARWNYKQANQYLEKHLSLVPKQSYEAAVAQLNYLQGLVYLHDGDKGFNLARELIEFYKKNNYKFLLVGTLEFLSELHRQKKEFIEARHCLDQAFKELGSSSTIDEFLLRKQQALIDLYELPNQNVIEQIKALKKEAGLRRHFESQRDLDFHLALVTKDERLMRNCYWQSQSESFKNRVVQATLEHNWNIDLKSDFHLTGNAKKNLKAKPLTINLVSANGSNEKSLGNNLKLAALFRALLSEGYKPKFSSDLFDSIYSGELYSPVHTKIKIHQLISRLRLKIENNNWPFKISFTKEAGYRILPQDLVILTVREEISDVLFLRICNLFGNSTFKYSDLAREMNQPRRTIFRILNRWFQNHWLEKVGSNKTRLYKISTQALQQINTTAIH